MRSHRPPAKAAPDVRHMNGGGQPRGVLGDRAQAVGNSVVSDWRPAAAAADATLGDHVRDPGVGLNLDQLGGAGHMIMLQSTRSAIEPGRYGGRRVSAFAADNARGPRASASRCVTDAVRAARMVPAQIEVIPRYLARQAAHGGEPSTRSHLGPELGRHGSCSATYGPRGSIPPDICDTGGIELRPWQTRRRPHDALPVEVRRRWSAPRRQGPSSVYHHEHAVVARRGAFPCGTGPAGGTPRIYKIPA
jgi:hypothetical protein